MTPAELRAAREALGLSQKALAKRLGVAQTSVLRWESGARRIEHPELLRLALAQLNANKPGLYQTGV